jgi:hypothetical protein
VDRELRRQVGEALAQLGRGVEGRVLADRESAAVYRIEPGQEAMALACLRCRLVTVRPGLPRKLELWVSCNNCGQAWRLRPPPEVLFDDPDPERRAEGRLEALRTTVRT